jgi:hypothetical protein
VIEKDVRADEAEIIRVRRCLPYRAVPVLTASVPQAAESRPLKREFELPNHVEERDATNALGLANEGNTRLCCGSH